MHLKDKTALLSFFNNYLAEHEDDEKAIQAFIGAASDETQQQVIEQLRQITGIDISLEDLGTEANRWFGDTDEARTWLQQILERLQANQIQETSVVKDSNGTVLNEGDSVIVIKDLKVKGGSSDLKRGTLIRKIHLIDDPDNIECRVEGSTLVLKTCFLKKA